MSMIMIQRKQASRRRRPPSLNSHGSDRRERDEATTDFSGARAVTPADEEASILTISPTQDEILPGISQRLATKALTIRQTEERLLELFAEGRLFGTVHTCIGQEWIGVAVAEALKPGDYVFSNHRGHGHYLAVTDDVEGLIAEIMGRSTGVCGGRGGSQHLCRDGFFSNGIQGGIAPVAAGLAMARRLEGGSNIATVFLGDGTLGEGCVYETLNLAAKWALPLLIVIEDNGIAQSTRQDETLAGTIKGRAHAFNIDVCQADTWNPKHLIDTTRETVRRIRQTRRPTVLHVKTYRLKAHSKGDDDRPAEEVQAFARADTLNQLLQNGDRKVHDICQAIDRRLDQAIQEASAASFAECEPARTSPAKSERESPRWKPCAFPSRRIADTIRQALEEGMKDNERIILLGEDIRDPYGGAFKITSGLSQQFDDRVWNTPISEAAIVGIANGLALGRWQPVVEIMFGDFLLLAADQFINHAAKFAWMYNHQVQVPVIIRTPSGGYRGYGPTHSQCLEKHFLGVPGTRVIALHERCCPYDIYKHLLAQNDRPTLVIENKTLYGRHTNAVPPKGYELTTTDGPFPTVRLSPPGERQLTIVTYGGLVSVAESAMIRLEDEDLACDLFLPTQLYPLDITPIAESVRDTRRLLVVEEGQGFSGLGSELIAQLTSDHHLGPFRAERVHAAPCPIPAAKPAEQTILPDTETVVKAALKLIEWSV